MKKLLIGAGILVLLLVAAVIAIPFIVPVDTMKAELVTKVKEATGRDLRINGPVSFSVLPSIALEAQDVSFSNPPGASSPDMAKFAKLDVDLKLIPLLSRRVEIAKLTLVDPVISLEIDKQGRPNWQFGAASPTAPAPAAPAASAPPASSSASLSGLELDDVGLDNGTLSYVDQRTDEKFELDKVAMRLSLPALDSPFKAEGSAVYRGETMSLTVTVADPGSLMREKGSAATVKLASKPIAFDFDGEAAGTTPLKLDGTVSLKVPSVRGLAQWAGVAFNAQGSGFGPLAISGKVSYGGNKIGFSDAKLSLDQINAQGELAVDTGGARPSLKGKLDVDKLDVNPYLAPQSAAKSSDTGGGGGWSDAPLELGALKAADVDFNLSANALLYRKLQIGKSALTLHLKDGRFETDLAQLALYQGSGKGKVVVDGSGSTPAIEVQAALSQVQLEPLLKDYMAMDRLSGVGAINFNVTGHGKSERDIIGTLGGNGNLNVANGKIKGMNLVAMVKNVGSAFQGGSQSTQETDFTSLTGTFTIANGVAHNNDLQLKSADVPMTGAGTIDLPRRTVDYKVTPRVAGVAVAVDIKGPWDNISYQPDLAGMGTELLKGGAKGVEDTIKKNPGDMLKGVLGR